ncbi:hypothetical protein CDD80_1893 [Ophiocordyceps camponoti-rufipedis]|uniref:Uncharacterized protein n=1 Tax=Ophiocordyceps camponoti-rufipedis TaxID=2004952 RepID=A0A2C5Z8H1_9HYPO|nr:hypothetical protein CDD80_1893 [Ophiocordyceps camponoti-rufipedis]
MKFFVIVVMPVFQAVFAQSVVSVDQDPDTLSIMTMDSVSLPDESLDKPREHGNSSDGTLSTTRPYPNTKRLFMLQRGCWSGRKFGCSAGGYCFKSCGPQGQWCWVARRGLKKRNIWITCKEDSDCNSDMLCGRGCVHCRCGC